MDATNYAAPWSELLLEKNKIIPLLLRNQLAQYYIYMNQPPILSPSQKNTADTQLLKNIF
jgi:hypothetical protein